MRSVKMMLHCVLVLLLQILLTPAAVSSSIRLPLLGVHTVADRDLSVLEFIAESYQPLLVPRALKKSTVSSLAPWTFPALGTSLEATTTFCVATGGAGDLQECTGEEDGGCEGGGEVEGVRSEEMSLRRFSVEGGGKWSSALTRISKDIGSAVRVPRFLKEADFTLVDPATTGLRHVRGGWRGRVSVGVASGGEETSAAGVVCVVGGRLSLSLTPHALPWPQLQCDEEAWQCELVRSGEENEEEKERQGRKEEEKERQERKEEEKERQGRKEEEKERQGRKEEEKERQERKEEEKERQEKKEEEGESQEREDTGHLFVARTNILPQACLYIPPAWQWSAEAPEDTTLLWLWWRGDLALTEKALGALTDLLEAGYDLDEDVGSIIEAFEGRRRRAPSNLWEALPKGSSRPLVLWGDQNPLLHLLRRYLLSDRHLTLNPFLQEFRVDRSLLPDLVDCPKECESSAVIIFSLLDADADGLLTAADATQLTPAAFTSLTQELDDLVDELKELGQEQWQEMVERASPSSRSAFLERAKDRMVQSARNSVRLLVAGDAEAADEEALKEHLPGLHAQILKSRENKSGGKEEL